MGVRQRGEQGEMGRERMERDGDWGRRDREGSRDRWDREGVRESGDKGVEGGRKRVNRVGDR